jgi:tetratricopeptide (TPR) repeat protein
VEPVCWIAGVPDCGCGLFFLLAFVIFLRAEKAPQRRWAWHALGGTVYFLALLFKEMAISMPLLLAVYWFVMADAESWWHKGLRWLPYATAAAAYLGVRIIVLGHVSHAPHLWKISPRVAEAAVGLLGQHTKLFFWPTGLNDFRDLNLAASLRSPWPWITLLVLGLAVLLRKHDPAGCFLILWWPLTLLPCLDVRQLSYPLLADRFSYLPSMGLSLAVTYFALQTLPERFRGRHLARVLVPALGLALALMSVQDLRAVPRWRDNETLWNYSYQVAPQSALVHVHRALDLQYRQNDPAGAIREYDLAIQLDGGSFLQSGNAAYSRLLGLGQIANMRGRSDEAVGYFERAVKIMPSEIAAYALLGSVYFPRGDYARAAEYFQQAVRVNPQDVGVRFFLGTCWLKLGKRAQAAEQFHAAREVDPTYFQAYFAEAAALDAAGDSGGAAKVRELMKKK